MEIQNIHKSIDKMYEEIYFTKIKKWAESIGMPGDMTARRILRISTSTNHNICKGKLSNGKKCTKPSKCNGYCGYHKKQFNEERPRQINWNRQNTENNVSLGLVIP